MKAYAKGARGERELLHFLNYKGFSCTRTASSGGYVSPLDILAIKGGLILAFEIKSWSKKPRLERNKLKRFREWCERAGAIGFLAWRNSGQWLFLKISDAESGNYEDERWIRMEDMLSVFGVE